MPRNLPHFTRCAPPGLAHTFSIPGVILTFIAVGLIGYFAAGAFDPTCGQIVIALALGLIAALDSLEFWFYNERLMCILHDQCLVGTIAGDPRSACDGDRKLDTLIAPFGFQDVDSVRMTNAINALAATFPLIPPNLATDRTVRLNYVETALSNAQRRLLYMELVHNQMLNDPARNFQGHFYRREQPPMPPDAFNNSPFDGPGNASSNPLFRFDGDEIPSPGPIDSFFCQTLLGVPNDEVSEHRLVPYIHCEIEGNRLQRALTNLKLSIVAFAAAYVAACSICLAITLGAGGILCSLAAAVIAALISWLVWLLSKLFNDPDDGEVDNIPIDQPDPTAPDTTTASARGDVVLMFGDWIKDTEHEEYFELHPVKSWFLICRDPDGATVPVEDPNIPNCAFDVTTFTRANLDEMCRLVTRSETTDPPASNTNNTKGALAVAGGLR